MSGLPPPPQPSDPDQPGWAAPPGAAPPPAGPPPGWGTAPPPGVAPPFGGAHPGPPRPPGAPGWGPPPPGAMGPPGQYPATGPYPPTGPYGAPPPGPYPPTGPYGAPPPKGMPGWGWALVAVGGLVGLAVVSILAITFLGESASSRFSTISSRGDSPGFVDSDAETYGDNAVLDQLWDRCEAGSGQACDDLYWDSPVGSEYEEFGNTCGRRYSGYDVPFSCAEEMGV